MNMIKYILHFIKLVLDWIRFDFYQKIYNNNLYKIRYFYFHHKKELK